MTLRIAQALEPQMLPAAPFAVRPGHTVRDPAAWLAGIVRRLQADRTRAVGRQALADTLRAMRTNR